MARGDHLYVLRGYGAYTHHGIDCGDGTVIHYKEGEAIARTSLAFFSRGEQVGVQVYGAADPSDSRSERLCQRPDDVIKRAESRIGERDYNLVFNNCEHFVVWCKTGRHQSTQVDRAVGATLVGGVLLSGGFAAPAIAAAAGVYGLGRLMEQANRSADPRQAGDYLAEALGRLAVTRDERQGELDRVLRSAYEWDCTARLAIDRGRDDLARAALERKYPLKKQALALRDQLVEIEQLRREIQSKTPVLPP
jgi:Lecithin retinol acyltransferase